MRRRLTFSRLGMVALALVWLACERAPTDHATPPAPVPSPSGASVVESDAPAAADASAASPSSVTPFGVAECDNYVSKYLACVDGKVPAEEKEELMAAFEANRTKWRALATLREGAIALGLACRAAAQKSKEQLAVDYGCEF